MARGPRPSSAALLASAVRIPLSQISEMSIEAHYKNPSPVAPISQKSTWQCIAVCRERSCGALVCRRPPWPPPRGDPSGEVLGVSNSKPTFQQCNKSTAAVATTKRWTVR
ncbi:hypothetical protein Zmor_010151 [Zophobas morio]|uniref:Uncharacterized protein n=1 Tax=Zophobas morio TaxID=2755281 RepID=A0AA38IND8_9CUCU|nr:hypothetical protein Zmor_010151 [Zophobas morio]